MRNRELPQRHSDTESFFERGGEWFTVSVSLCLCGLIVLLLSALNARAQTQAQPAVQNGSVSFGAIAGRVMCEDGSVSFAQVTVTSVGARGQGNSTHTVTTDADGNFKADGLRAAALQIQVNAPGYVLQDAAVSVAGGDADAPVEVVAQRYYRIGDDVTIFMVKGGVITGRVLNPAGDPVIGVRVAAQPLNAAAAQAPQQGYDAQTDDRGIYRIFGLPTGSYVVVASAGAMSGGAGFGGGRGGGPQRNQPVTDAPVYYPSGSRATAAEVVVNSGVESNGIDIQYRVIHGSAISGTVASANTTEGGRGGGFTTVTLTDKASGQVVNTAFLAPGGFGGPGGGGRGGRGGRGAGNSNADTFTLLGVADGEYEITAQRNGGGELEASAPVRVVVSGKEVTGIALALKPLASVRALLHFENPNKCPAPRAAVLDEQVFALRADVANESKVSLPRGSALIGTPNRTGELNFRGLVAGRYRLNAQLLDERWFIRSIALPAPTAPAKTAPVTKAAPIAPAKTTTLTTLLDASRNGLTLKAGERLDGVVVSVAEGAAALDGKVVNSKTNAPLRVHLIPAERERAEDVLRYAETQTVEDGAFRFRNLAPGKYWLLAQPAPAALASQPEALDAAARARLRRLAETANQALELQPCQRLRKYELPVK